MGQCGTRQSETTARSSDKEQKERSRESKSKEGHQSAEAVVKNTLATGINCRGEDLGGEPNRKEEGCHSCSW